MKIFLSAVTKQFEDCRNHLRSDLTAIGCEVKVQEDFQQGPGTTLQNLESLVSQCDRVIALVGSAYGSKPPPDLVPEPKRGRSYTQWEYFFALGERLSGTSADRKELYVYVASEAFLAGRRIDEDPDNAACQRTFLEDLKNGGEDQRTFESLDHLCRQVLRDGWHFSERPRPYKSPLFCGGYKATIHPDPQDAHERHAQERYAGNILQELKELKRNSQIAAVRVAEKNIANTMGALTERFGAASAWLFLRDWIRAPGEAWIERGCPIKLRFTHNTGLTVESRIRLPATAHEEGEGIVGFVAATSRPFLVKDVNVPEQRDLTWNQSVTQNQNSQSR